MDISFINQELAKNPLKDDIFKNFLLFVVFH